MNRFILKKILNAIITYNNFKILQGLFTSSCRNTINEKEDNSDWALFNF